MKQSYKALLVVVAVLLPSTTRAGSILDLSSPEKTLSGYLNCIEVADEQCVLKHYNEAKSFHLGPPQKIDYSIIKKIVYGKEEVDDWNGKGIVPPVKLGDVELHVREKLARYEGMWSYVFRKIESDWYIISHAAWDQP